MARSTLAVAAVKTPKGPNPVTVAPGDLHITPAAADSVNGNQFAALPGDIVHARNTHATLARTVTLTSSPDERGRLGNIAAYSLAAGEEMYFYFGDETGWRQPDGFIYLDASTADIVWAVLRRP